jgi:hypothetical protein
MTLSFVLQLIGLIAEIMGAAFLGRAFTTRVHLWKIPLILLSSLFGTDHAKGFARITPPPGHEAQILDGLKGSALLWIGFVLQFVGLLTQRSS